MTIWLGLIINHPFCHSLLWVGEKSLDTCNIVEQWLNLERLGKNIEKSICLKNLDNYVFNWIVNNWCWTVFCHYKHNEVHI